MNINDTWQQCFLSYEKGGMAFPFFHLEVGVIPMIRTILHLLNMPSPLGRESRAWITELMPIVGTKGLSRLSLGMRRMMPLGVSFCTLSVLQLSVAGSHPASFHVRSLMEFPNAHEETMHWHLCIGGPVFHFLRLHMDTIKTVVAGYYNCDDLLCSQTCIMLHRALAAFSGTEFFPPGVELSKLCRAICRALEDSRKDTLSECCALGIPAPQCFFIWPDWVGDSCPVWEYVSSQLNALALPAGQCSDGEGLIVGTDGSVKSEGGIVTGAGYGVVICKLSRELIASGSWESKAVNSHVLQTLCIPAPLYLGCTEIASFETETYALLRTLFILRHNLQSCFIITDAKSMLDGAWYQPSVQIDFLLRPAKFETNGVHPYGGCLCEHASKSDAGSGLCQIVIMFLAQWPLRGTLVGSSRHHR